MAGSSSNTLPAKVQRRVRRVAGRGVRAMRRGSAAGQRLEVRVQSTNVAEVAATLTPWATRRPLAVAAYGPSCVRALAAAVDPATTTIDLDVWIRLPPRWSRPRGHVRLALPDIERIDIVEKPRSLQVKLRMKREIPLSSALWAIGSLLTPAVVPHADGSADIHITEAGHPDLAAFGVGAWMQIGPYESSDAAQVEAESAITLPASRPDTPVIDLSVANPVGLKISRLPERITGTLRVDGATVTLTGTDETVVAELAAGQLLDEGTVHRTRAVAGAMVQVSGDARAAAQRLAELAATGLVLSVPDLAAPVSHHLDAELVPLLQRPLPSPTTDGWTDRLTWQAHSSRQRRAAMRAHGAAYVLGRHVGRDVLPEVSVLLVTNRPDMVADAVGAVARQTYSRLEVVVGLHGHSADSLPPAAVAALADLPHRSIIVAVDADRTLGEALTQCTQAASGSLLVKMDDDDRYGPEHVWDLVLARTYSGADLVGKAPEITELQASQQLVLRSFALEEAWGAYVIGATMLVARSALLEVGGWRPTPWAVDKALLDRFGQRGRNVYRAHNLGWAYVRRGSGHTWEQDDAYFRGQAKRVWDADSMPDVLDLVVEQA